MALPVTTVEIAFSTTPDDPSPVWVDVTQYVRTRDGISIVRGRQDQFSEVQPSTLALTLINSDGRFTPGNAGSPYYPNVKKGRKIRVSVTHNAVTYRRFTGFVNEWPVTWADASATVADTRLTASSRMARLGRGNELPSIVEAEYLLDSPAAYYPLGEPEGATQAGNVSTTLQPALAFAGTGANPTFGTATGPGTDGLTAASFTGGKYLSTALDQPIVTSSHTTFTAEIFFNTSTTSTAHDLLWVDTRNGSGEASGLYIEHPSGKLRARGDGPGGAPTNYFLASSGAVWDGATHHALIRETISGGNLTATLYLDGVQVDTSTTAYAGFGARDRLRVGGGVFNTITGTLAHAAVTPGTTELSTTRIAAHSNAGLTGFSGESSGVRVRRLALYAGVPEGEIDIATGLSTSITNQLTNGQQPIALMRDVARTEGGVLFDSGDGLLTFHARSHRYNALSALTLSAGGGELQANLEPRLDDQGLVNDVTASREGGISVRAVDTTSVDEHGVYREDVQLLTTSDNEVRDAANWKVLTASTPQVSVPVAEADLGEASTSQKTAILAREIGDRITLASLPSQAPASSMDFFIEGSTELITAERYMVAFNLSPAALSGVWQLDSSVYSVLGTSTRLAY